MKKIVSILLVLAMATTMFVACNSGDEKGEKTTTTTKATTTTRDGGDLPDLPEVPEDKTLLQEQESEWKYNVVEVSWESATSGAMDYLHATKNGFVEFVTANPEWMMPSFDDSEWGSKEAPFGNRISEANASNIGWTGDNHGLFLRTTFTVTQEDIDSLKAEETSLYAWCWYDNTCHMYINGTEVFEHDESDLFVEGTPGNSGELGVHDWNDTHDMLYFDSSNDHYVYDGNVADLLVVGENTLAVSLLDCWGDREFDLGLYIEYQS